MEKNKIFFAYKHTEKPWGGANNFIRALFCELSKNQDFHVHHDVDQKNDILFFSQLSQGPGNVELGKTKKYSLSDIKKFKKNNQAKLIARAVNLNINSEFFGIQSIPFYLLKGLRQDIESIKFFNLADFVIFQSEFQKSFFQKWGYRGKNNIVVHNGAAPIFQNDDFSISEPHFPLKLVSNSNFKTFKKHDIVAKMSLLEGVEVSHIGTWSPKIKKNHVKLLGTLTHEEIVEVYKNSDYLLHPAVFDPCPNVVVEALHFGLPVIFSDEPGGARELAKDYGIPIDRKNLGKTIKAAKNNIIMLKKKLQKNREYYSIKRAVSAYAEIFKKIKNYAK